MVQHDITSTRRGSCMVVCEFICVGNWDVPLVMGEETFKRTRRQQPKREAC